MLQLNRETWSRWHWALPALGCVLLLWAGYSWWQAESPAVHNRLTISGGPAVTSRQYLAGFLAREARSATLDIELRETAGTEEILDLLQSGELDVGLVTGGFRSRDRDHVRQLAALGLEPLQLFVKRELLRESAPGLEVLRGRTVNMEAPGSSVFALSTEVMEFAGLRSSGENGEPGDYVQRRLSSRDLVERAQALRVAEPADREARRAELPDAVFLLNPLPARTARALVSTAQYQLVSLDFATAFRMNGDHHLDGATSRIDRLQVEPTVIPAHVYGVLPAIPAADCPTLGVPTFVVAREGLPRQAVEQLVAALYDGPFAAEMGPKDLLTEASVYPVEPVVTTYLEHRKPLEMKDAIEWSQNALSMFGAFSAGVFTVYGLYRRSRGRNPKTYLAEIGVIERDVLTMADRRLEPQVEHEQLVEREQQLATLKQQLMEDYALGHSMGDSAFANLMTLIADARANLYRVAQKRPSHDMTPGGLGAERGRGGADESLEETSDHRRRALAA